MTSAVLSDISISVVDSKGCWIGYVTGVGEGEVFELLGTSFFSFFSLATLSLLAKLVQTAYYAYTTGLGDIVIPPLIRQTRSLSFKINFTTPETRELHDLNRCSCSDDGRGSTLFSSQVHSCSL